MELFAKHVQREGWDIQDHESVQDAAKVLVSSSDKINMRRSRMPHDAKRGLSPPTNVPLPYHPLYTKLVQILIPIRNLKRASSLAMVKNWSGRSHTMHGGTQLALDFRKAGVTSTKSQIRHVHASMILSLQNRLGEECTLAIILGTLGMKT